MVLDLVTDSRNVTVLFDNYLIIHLLICTSVEVLCQMPWAQQGGPKQAHEEALFIIARDSSTIDQYRSERKLSQAFLARQSSGLQPGAGS